MGKRDEQKAIIRDRIYEAALDLFCAQGYNAVSLSDIAKEAKVSTRTLHKYYPHKSFLLQRFSRENLIAVSDYANSLPKSLPLKDRIIQVMVFDYQQMFLLFDMSFVLWADEDGIPPHPADTEKSFEIMNFRYTESIYYWLIADAQERAGYEPGPNTALVATILLGIYRHITDLYRYSHYGKFDNNDFAISIQMRLDSIWPSIERQLETPVAPEYVKYLEEIPVSDQFMKEYLE